MMDDLVKFIRKQLDFEEYLNNSSRKVTLQRTHYRRDMLASLDRDDRDVAAKRDMIVILIALHDTKPKVAEMMLRLLAKRWSHLPDYPAE